MSLPVVIIPLFDRPIRASLTIGRAIRGEQVRALANRVQLHLQNIAPVVEILEYAGWEVLAQETALLCRHPSVRTRAQAEVALCQLGVELHYCRICDRAEKEPLFPRPASNGQVPQPSSPTSGSDPCPANVLPS